MIRHIVLIAIDCLRSDHVSCYGYDRETTPTIDALAREGVLWEQTHSLSSWTKPSVTSLLTGLFPTQHGAFQGIKRSKGRHTVTTDILSSSQPTLAEELTKVGWRCGAFMNNAQLGEFTRLNRGFDTYIPTGGKADRLIEQYRAWLEKDDSSPAFAYLHFLEAHWPYKPRRRHVEMFGGDRNANYFREFSAREFGRLRRSISRGETTLPDEHLTQMIQMYDGAVRRLDGKVKVILGLLDELGLRDETAIVVTADHGEEFLDHGQIGHGQSLYNELTHVPLVAFVPGGPKGERRTAPVSHVDLARTLANLAGAGPGMPGRDLLTSKETTPYVYTELNIRNRYTQAVQSDRWKLHRRFRFDPMSGDAPDAGQPRQKLSSVPHQIKHELYDLDADSCERVNVAYYDEHATMLKTLEAELDRWWDEISAERGSDAVSEVDVDDLVVQRLRDLGYLD